VYRAHADRPPRSPGIGRETGADQGQLTWMIDAYAVTFAGLLLPCGALGGTAAAG
jgi:hypothetical protein